MWLKKLKAAVITHDVVSINKLLDEVPPLSYKELEEASFLLQEASKIAKALRNDVSLSMQKIQKSRDFLNATQYIQKQKLDITS